MQTQNEGATVTDEVLTARTWVDSIVVGIRNVINDLLSLTWVIISTCIVDMNSFGVTAVTIVSYHLLHSADTMVVVWKTQTYCKIRRFMLDVISPK